MLHFVQLAGSGGRAIGERGARPDGRSGVEVAWGSRVSKKACCCGGHALSDRRNERLQAPVPRSIKSWVAKRAPPHSGQRDVFAPGSRA